jgi:regulator of RNase E activity RraA
LASYEGIADNDIIVVENEEKDYAYFGDLNTRLAIRAGASGVIVDSATRDKVHTGLLNFPVFSRGYNATDVRRRATLDYINKPIKIGGKKVNPGDLIFVDECAVVIIYKKFEQEIIERVLNIFHNEKNIIGDILRNEHVEQIIDDRGAF